MLDAKASMPQQASTYFLMLNAKSDYGCFTFSDEKMYLSALDKYVELGWVD
jgi:hypothetical protein